jgi:hypothetical protein
MGLRVLFAGFVSCAALVSWAHAAGAPASFA